MSLRRGSSKSDVTVLILSAMSATCFALAVQAEDQFNVAKFGEPYRVYMKQVPALNLLAGIRTRIRARKGRRA